MLNTTRWDEMGGCMRLQGFRTEAVNVNRVSFESMFLPIGEVVLGHSRACRVVYFSLL